MISVSFVISIAVGICMWILGIKLYFDRLQATDEKKIQHIEKVIKWYFFTIPVNAPLSILSFIPIIREKEYLWFDWRYIFVGQILGVISYFLLKTQVEKS